MADRRRFIVGAAGLLGLAGTASAAKFSNIQANQVQELDMLSTAARGSYATVTTGEKTWYVSADLGSDSNNGSDDAPFKSVQKAWDSYLMLFFISKPLN